MPRGFLLVRRFTNCFHHGSMLRRPPRLALVCAALGAALGSTVTRAGEPPPGAGARELGTGTAPGTFAARRRREVDELRRQDLAQALGDEGIVVRWQDHGLAELTDWRDRIAAARALHDQFATDVDWRAVSLATLLDMRLRASKADELRAAYRIAVDWRGYTWNDLERLRASLAALHPAPPAGDAESQSAPWDADALAPFDPSRAPSRARRADARATGRPSVARVRMNLYDPDAIIEPLFAAETWSTVSRRSGRLGRLDSDAILAPSFEKIPPHISTNNRDPDELIEPFTSP